MREGLAAAGLSPSELALLRGNEPRKVEIARAVWEQTTVSMGWMAERLAMRSPVNVSQILKREKARKPTAKRRTSPNAVKIC